MTRIVHLTCARCGHQEMQVVEADENNEAVATTVRSTDGETSTSDAERQQRLKSLPTSLPVGGIITPV